MKAVIDTRELRRLINSTKGSMGKEDNRLMLTFIRLDFDKSTRTVTATALDGFKLAIEKTSLTYVDETFHAYIKPYLPVGIDSTATIEVKDGHCFISDGERCVGYKQPEGKWLDVDDLLKKYDNTPVQCDICIDAEYLNEALKSIKYDKPIRLEYRGEEQPIIIKKENSVRIVMVCRK